MSAEYIRIELWRTQIRITSGSSDSCHGFPGIVSLFPGDLPCMIYSVSLQLPAGFAIEAITANDSISGNWSVCGIPNVMSTATPKLRPFTSRVALIRLDLSAGHGRDQSSSTHTLKIEKKGAQAERQQCHWLAFSL